MEHPTINTKMKTVRRKILYLLMLLGSTIMIHGCYYDVGEELYPATNISSANCDTSNATYSSKVLSIIQNNCYSCHSGSAPSGNVNLQGYANLKIYVNNGKLMGTITHAAGFSPMPFGGNKLSTCDIATIQKWINNGSLNN